MDETYASMAWQAWRVPSVGLRLFNVYGPRQDPNGEYSAVIAKFADRLRNGKAPVIHGDGRQVRDFIHVDDVVRAFLAAASRIKKIGCDAVNVGTGTGTSILQLSEVMQRVFRCRVTPIGESERAGDIRTSVANTEKMTSLLGIRPSVCLEAGLKRTFQGPDTPLREPVRSAPARRHRRPQRENLPEREGPGR
jgi:UDP-glucose 4-epimerase